MCCSGMGILCNLVSVNNRCIESDARTQTEEKRHGDQFLIGNDPAD